MAAPARLGRPEIYINGAWVAPALGGTLDVICPADESVIGVVGAATSADVHAAVAAARGALAGWKRTPAAQRAGVMRAIAAGVRARRDELAVMESRDCGKPLDEAVMDIDDVAACFEFFADRGLEVDAANPAPVRAQRALPRAHSVVA
jgi:betaine-aldehyde dehydrogenase